MFKFLNSKPTTQEPTTQELIKQALNTHDEEKNIKREAAKIEADAREKSAIENIQVTHNNELKEILKVDKSQDLRDIILESIAADFYTGAKLPKLVDKFPLSKQSYDALVDEYVEKEVKDKISALETITEEKLSDKQITGLQTILKAAAKSVTITSKTELKNSVETIFNHIKKANETLIEQGQRTKKTITKVLARQCPNIHNLEPVVIYHRVIRMSVEGKEEGTVEEIKEAENQSSIVTENKGDNATPTYEYIFLEKDGTIGNCKDRYNVTYENGDYKDFNVKIAGIFGGRKSRKSSKKARRKTSRK